MLGDDTLQGAHSIDRVLRPPNPAQVVLRSDFGAAAEVIRGACNAWGGAYMPLIPVDASGVVDQTWVDLLDRSPVDGIDDRELVDTTVQFGYGFDTQIGSGLFLLRQLMDMPVPNPHKTVQTARGLSPDNPWFLSYLGTFGDHPSHHTPANMRFHRIRADYDYSDIVPIEGFSGTPGAGDILSRLRAPNTMTAVKLTLSNLAHTASPLDSSFPSAARVRLADYPTADVFGPNIVVVYEPDSVDDLALLWYLRALHGFPHGFPLAIPATVDVAAGLSTWRQEQAFRLWGWKGGKMTLVSASVSTPRLLEFAEGTAFKVSTPGDVLRPFGGCGLVATDTAHYINGRAQIPRFAPTDREALGAAGLELAGGWSTVTAVVKDDTLPPSRTLRRSFYPGRGYLHGYCAPTSSSDSVLNLFHPTGLEVLTALARDHDQTVRPSAPGKAAEQLILMIGGMDGLTRLACPSITTLLTELTRGRNRTVISRQLRGFLKIDDDSETTNDRYRLLEDRLDEALTRPDVEDTAYKALSAIKSVTKLSAEAAAEWVRWAYKQKLLLRGFEARCQRCGHKQWRPLSDIAPELICHGCERTIPEPLGADQATLRYRASETALRAMNADVLPHILALRYLIEIWDGHSDGTHNVYGAYPGLEITDPHSGKVVAEADVAIILANGRWVVGECKTTARGLREDDLDKLNDFANRVDAIATFVATPDPADSCEEIWTRTAIHNGRPHFALTAEHLYDLHPFTPASADPLDWRSTYRNAGAEVDETELPKALSTYLSNAGDGWEVHRRAPWMRPAD